MLEKNVVGPHDHTILIFPVAKARMEDLHSVYRKVDIRLHGKGNSNSHGARPVHQKHLRHDEVDPDKLVVNEELSLSTRVRKKSALNQHGHHSLPFVEGLASHTGGHEEILGG